MTLQLAPFNDPETGEIIAGGMAMHRELGCGFVEPVYRAAFAIELAARGIPFKSEVALPIYYRGILLPTSYRADFICYDKIIVEIKALKSIGGAEEAQLINYLKASKLHRGLILNFGSTSLEFKRRVYNYMERSLPSDSER